MKRALGVLLAGACSVATEPLAFNAPPRENFRYVSAALTARCGSLDCHGGSERSLRLHHKFGLRLAPSDVAGGRQDTVAEHDANYTAILALEPELMHRVVREGGRRPERLTLFRKGRHLESHVGGRALDDATDRCLRSWVAGEVDAKTCFAASQLAKPPGFSGSSGTGGGGGTGGSGGTSGSGGLGAGGAGGSGGGGVVCFDDDFWPCTWDPECKPEKPAPVDHLALVAEDCMGCHAAGGEAGPGQEFFIAGVVWEWGAKQGAPGIEIGLRDGDTFHYTCTDSLGFFFLRAAGQPEPNWGAVETRARSELGEKTMPDDKEHRASCNSADCHALPDHQIWAP